MRSADSLAGFNTGASIASRPDRGFRVDVDPLRDGTRSSHVSSDPYRVSMYDG